MATTSKGRRTAKVPEDELRQVVESIGLWFEVSGMPRMAGRVVGWLMLCDPPEQTMQDLADNLGASMGSISTMTRSLSQFRLIERTSRPGERRIRYRLRSDAWTSTAEEDLAMTRSFVEIADQALAVLEDAPAARRERLQSMRDAILYYDDTLESVIAEWKNSGLEQAGR